MSSELTKTGGAALTAPAAPTTPMQLLQMAVEREGSIDVIERLAKLQTDMLDREARIAYINAFEEFKRNAPQIVKDAEILVSGQVRGKFAKLDQVANKLIPSLLAVGITHRWQTENMPDGRIQVTCFLRHRLGYEERGSNIAGPSDTSGSKNAIQAIGSTVSYFERYTMLASCGIAVQDQDNNGSGNTAMSEGDVLTWNAAIEGSGSVDELQRNYIGALKAAAQAGDRGVVASFDKVKSATYRTITGGAR